MINAVLDAELEPGLVHLSPQAHRHMAEDHPNDYAICITALPAAIASPTFIGQAPGHVRNFEIIKRVAALNGRLVLVAIAIDHDERGAYRIRTSYLVSNEAVDKRRRAGRLRPPRPGP